MNNAAFADLVRKRARGPSTKEYARQVVEEEFRSKRKRQHDSSSDEDEADNDEKPISKKKQALQEQEEEKEEEKLQAERLASMYRDRAKERREDVIADSDDETDDPIPATKGLDIEAARKVREQLKELQARPKRKGLDPMKKIMEDLKDVDKAKKFLLEWVEAPSTDASMAEYVRLLLDGPSQKVSSSYPTSAGQTLQRSSLEFALRSRPWDRNRAWETPREASREAELEFHKMTPLSSETINSIHRSLVEAQEAHRRAEMLREQEGEKSGLVPSKPAGKLAEDSDGDDDIFNDAGIDYIPPDEAASAKAIQAQASPDTATDKKKSIFDSLVAGKKEEKPEPDVVQDFVNTLLRTKTDKGQSGAGTAMNGASDYDAMDADFDGRDDDDDDDSKGSKSKKKKRKKKKKRSEESTLAVQEYGASGSRGLR